MNNENEDRIIVLPVKKRDNKQQSEISIYFKISLTTIIIMAIFNIIIVLS